MKKYVIFEGLYNGTQAAAQCSAESGTLALAGDHHTYHFMFNMYMVYWWPGTGKGGAIKGVYIDGTNVNGVDWLSVNTADGKLPSTVQWHPGQPNFPSDQKCIRMFPQYNKGVGDAWCHMARMVMCQFLA